MVRCTQPECQTTAGCQCGWSAKHSGAAVVDWSGMKTMIIGGPQPNPDAPSEDYKRGWDDCLDRVIKVLGETFPRRIR